MPNSKINYCFDHNNIIKPIGTISNIG